MFIKMLTIIILLFGKRNKENQDKVLHDYTPKVKEIVIPRPQRKVKKRELFTFLDEEVD